MTDRAKETIFNVLGSICQSATVLDLFAGSGSLGLEALSRGAQEVYFVDEAKIAQDCIQKNVDSLSINKAKVQIIGTPVPEVIHRLEKKGKNL